VSTQQYDEFKAKYDVRANEILKANPNDSPEQIKAKLQKVAEETARDVWHGDKVFFRYAIVLLGIIVLVVVFVAGYLLANGKTPTDGIIAIGSGAVGALVGLFSSSK
jgi:hypothetical protein